MTVQFFRQAEIENFRQWIGHRLADRPTAFELISEFVPELASIGRDCFSVYRFDDARFDAVMIEDAWAVLFNLLDDEFQLAEVSDSSALVVVAVLHYLLRRELVLREIYDADDAAAAYLFYATRRFDIDRFRLVLTAWRTQVPNALGYENEDYTDYHIHRGVVEFLARHAQQGKKIRPIPTDGGYPFIAVLRSAGYSD